ncbi:MAG: hypothetical protein JWO92_876 [Chitinophagaceae bacterium]|nr:hypothetical protein [Chitinophagaceae bacterium]
MHRLFYKYILLLFFIYNGSVFCQSLVGKDSTDIKDSLDFIKTKKNCHIIEYTDKNAAAYFHTNGEFIKAYTFSSADNMMRFSVAKSTTETIWTLDLKAYGKIWAHNPVGIEAIGGGYAQQSIKMPEVPIKVEFDEQLKLYVYSAHLVSSQPFANQDDQRIAINIMDILTSSIYRLYVFEHKNKNTQLMEDCSSKIMYQMMSKEDRDKSREQARIQKEEFEPLMKEAEKLDKERKKNSSATKTKTKKKGK